MSYSLYISLEKQLMLLQMMFWVLCSADVNRDVLAISEFV